MYTHYTKTYLIIPYYTHIYTLYTIKPVYTIYPIQPIYLVEATYPINIFINPFYPKYSMDTLYTDRLTD